MHNIFISSKKEYKSKKLITRYIYIVFVLQFIFIISQNLGFQQDRPIYNFIGNFLLSLGFLIYFFDSKFVFSKSEKIIVFWIVYMFLLLLLGLVLVKDSVNNVILLASLPSFIIPLSFIFFRDMDNSLRFFVIIRKIIIPIYAFLLLYYIYKGEILISFDTYLLHFFIFFIFIWNKKTALLLIVFLALQFVMTLQGESRSMNLSIISLTAIVIISKFINKRSVKYFKYLLFVPIFFLVLAVSGIFNVLSVGSNSSSDSDTRSQLFNEVYTHLQVNDAVLWGTTPGIGYKTSLADVSYYNNGEFVEFWTLWHNGRLSTEAGFVNVFLWGGLLNVIFYFLIFWYVVSFASKYANNTLAYSLILFICFRWAFSFIDGVFTYSYQNLTFWIAIGLCLNKNFLLISEKKLKLLLK